MDFLSSITVISKLKHKLLPLLNRLFLLRNYLRYLVSAPFFIIALYGFWDTINNILHNRYRAFPLNEFIAVGMCLLLGLFFVLVIRNKLKAYKLAQVLSGLYLLFAVFSLGGIVSRLSGDATLDRSRIVRVGLNFIFSWLFFAYHKETLRISLKEKLIAAQTVFGNRMFSTLLRIGGWVRNYLWQVRSASWKGRLRLTWKPILFVLVCILVYQNAYRFAPPKVVTVYPGQDAQNIPLDTVFELTFSQPMNKAWVEKNVKVQPSITGTFTWRSERELVFKPNQALQRGTSYTFEVSGLAVSRYFVPAFKGLSTSFKTLGHPQVALASPQTEAPEKMSPITVMFDRAMVPFTTATNSAVKLSPLTLVPALEGEGRWLGTTTFQFRPTEVYQPATIYTYTIAKGLPSEDGGSLQEDISFSFSTQRPHVLATTPETNYLYANPEASVSAQFNLPIDLKSAQNSLELAMVDGEARKPVEGTVRMKGNQVGFYPNQTLARGKRYEMTIKSGLLSTKGPNGLASDYTWEFTVAPFPKVIATTPVNGSKDVEEDHSISVSFVSPMDEDSFKGNIIISPDPGLKPSIFFSSYNNINNLNIGTYLGRSTDYEVTVKGSVKDIYGVPLGSDYTFRFNTAPLKPSISIEPQGQYFASFKQSIVPRIVVRAAVVQKVTYNLYRLSKEDVMELYKLRCCTANISNELRSWQAYDPSKHEKVRTWQETFEAEPNVPVNVITKVAQANGEPIPSGFYFIDASIDGGGHDNMVMIVGNSSLTLKTSEKQSLIWAVDTGTGQTMEGVTVEAFRINDRSQIDTGVTNASGVYVSEKLTAPKDTYAYNSIVFASKNGDVAAVAPDWNSGIESYSFGLPYYYDEKERDLHYQSQDKLKLYLMVDRPIYRPGQTVYFKGVVRTDNDGQYALVDGTHNAAISLRDSRGKTVYSESKQLNSFGSFSGEYALGKDISLGDYELDIQVSGEGYSQRFQVEEYRKPDFEVLVETDKPEYVKGELVKATIESKYYFGASVSESPVTWTVTTQDYPFTWDRDTRFEFGDSDAYWYRPWWYFSTRSYYDGERVTQGKGRTNSEGTLDVNIPYSMEGKTTDQRLRVEAIVEASNNQSIANSKEFVIYSSTYHAGIKPKRYSSNAGETTAVELVVLNNERKEIPDVPVDVSFYKRTWDYVRELNEDDGQYYWTSKPKDELISQAQVKTDSIGRAVAEFTPSEGGSYRAVAIVTDPSGKSSKSSAYLWVSGSGWKAPKENHDRITLIPDKQEYAVGENAQFFAALPFEQSTGLVTVERAGIFDYQIVNMSADKQIFSVPIKDVYVPNGFVSAAFIKQGTSVKDPPQFKMGISEIKVVNPAKKLSIEIQPNKQSYSPGETMEADIIVKNGLGQPVNAEMAVAVVDKAVWSLARAEVNDIYDTFYRSRSLGVQTSNDLTISMDRINANVDLGSKGGSGGGGGDGGPNTSRDTFLDNAYWNAHLTSDAQGRAHIQVKLPDNLTTWRVLAVGLDTNTAVGDTATEVMVTKHVLVSPLVPRFVSNGDQPKIGLTIHNTTSSPSQTQVSIQSEGLRFSGETEKRVSVPAYGSQTVLFDSTVTSAEKEMGLVLTAAQEGKVLDSVKLNIPVKTFYTRENVATSGQSNGSASEKILLPKDIVPNMGTLSMTVSPSLGMEITHSYPYLYDYDYWCPEQTASKLSSSLSMLELMKAAKLNYLGGYRQDQYERLINYALQHLVSNQLPDGGWGWWGTTFKSNPVMSALVFDSLMQAKKSGQTVDSSMLTDAASYLRGKLTADSLDQQVMVASALSKFEKISDGVLDAYMDRRWQLSQTGRAYLLRTLQQNHNNAEANKVFDELMASAKRTNTLSYWEENDKGYGLISNTNVLTSLVLEGIVAKNPNDPLVNETIRWLIQARKGNRWYSTRDTALVIRAITGTMLAKQEGGTKEDWKITLGGNKVLDGSFNSKNLLDQKDIKVAIQNLQIGVEMPVVFDKSGKGNLYYSSNLEYYLPFEKTESLERGMVLIRELADANGKLIDSSKVPVNKELYVKLTLVVPQQANHVMIEDMLPAGFEPVNESLATTGVLNSEGLTPSKGARNLYFQYQEMHDDKVMLFAPYVSRGVYEYSYRVRTTTAGRYHHAPAMAYNMYYPDVFGRSGGDWLEVVSK